jgi:hypothetical protein
MTANFLSRNCPTACRSPLRTGQNQRRPPKLRRSYRHRHALGSFGPRNKHGHRRSLLLHEQNCRPLAGGRSLHSKSRQKPPPRPDARHPTERKRGIAAGRRLSGRETVPIGYSSVLSTFLVIARMLSRANALLLPTSKPLRGFDEPFVAAASVWEGFQLHVRQRPATIL